MRANPPFHTPSKAPKPCAWLSPSSLHETVAYLVRRFEIERRRQRRAYLFVARSSGAVYLLPEDCPLVEHWVLTRLPDYVGCYFTGRHNTAGQRTEYAMPPTAEGLVEDLREHMGF